MTRIANTFTTFGNGNNLTVAADVVRRTLQCSLDADMEDPGTRTFSADPVAIVLADRGRYIAACLTIARAYIVAGRPGCLPPHASFEGWSNLVRSALCWLNWPDPVDTVAGIRAADPIRQERAALFNAWAAELGCEYGYQTSELIAMTDTRPAWRDAVLAVGSARFNRSQIDPRRFGNWLRGAANTIAAGHKLIVDRHDVKRPRWILS